MPFSIQFFCLWAMSNKPVVERQLTDRQHKIEKQLIKLELKAFFFKNKS